MSWCRPLTKKYEGFNGVDSKDGDKHDDDDDDDDDSDDEEDENNGDDYDDNDDDGGGDDSDDDDNEDDDYVNNGDGEYDVFDGKHCLPLLLWPKQPQLTVQHTS
ncbi:unnamed protein product [Porites lobata]|uniref:Uncharacterized protein n=1 Tax=Porites lobata TaxID=104759 RepID=A0ABN8MZR7_9CNID|nr:unnamed protein product [Porites lobata]